MRLELSLEARIELATERNVYEAEREGLGLEFVREMRALMERIAESPMQFPKLPRSKARCATVERFPFKIIFFVMPDHVRVIAIAPQAKRPGYWRGRS